MDTPSNAPRKPNTRSHNKKKQPTPGPAESSVIDLANSPVLRSRRNPAAKKMAEDKILDAIKVVSTSVTAIEKRMGSFSTKTDINNMVAELKEVKEKVVVNSINIEKLFELRKDDQDNLHKKVRK